MFGAHADMKTIDRDASIKAFQNQVEIALKKEFPRAGIEVSPGISSVLFVNYTRDNPNTPFVDSLIYEVWQGFCWVVNQD